MQNAHQVIYFATFFSDSFLDSTNSVPVGALFYSVLEYFAPFYLLRLRRD
jgi:hypothetical protein